MATQLWRNRQLYFSVRIYWTDRAHGTNISTTFHLSLLSHKLVMWISRCWRVEGVKKIVVHIVAKGLFIYIFFKPSFVSIPSLWAGHIMLMPHPAFSLKRSIVSWGFIMKLQNTPLFSLFEIQNTNSVLLNHFACFPATFNGSGSSEAHSCSSAQPLLYLHYLVG